MITDSAIISSRVFQAPRSRIFQAFSNPDELVDWWGPKGFTNKFHEFDFRPGGQWRFTMHASDGSEYPNQKDFLEIVSEERIVFQHLGPIHRFQMEMTFDEISKEVTKLTWRMTFESPTEASNLRNFILQANEENFDRLEGHLSQTSS